jgi:hypothetical protein
MESGGNERRLKSDYQKKRIRGIRLKKPATHGDNSELAM